MVTRSKKTAPTEEPAVEETVVLPQEAESVTLDGETAEPTKRGRKPSSLAPLVAAYERAEAKHTKVNSAYDKAHARLEPLGAAIAEAKQVLDDAKQALADKGINVG